MLAQATMQQQELRLLEEMEQARNVLRSISGWCVDPFDNTGDLADQASQVVQVGTDQALRYVHEQELDHLQEAWARYGAGQYGICEGCGGQIEPDRLNALPYATECAGCRKRSR
jgi:RNA polymerase-binding transcription factor DksA